MKPLKKKVFLFNNYGVGGAERITLTLGKLLPQDEYEVHIVTVGRKRGDIRNFIPPYFHQHYIHTFNIWDFTTIKIAGLLLKERPYAVFSSLRYLNCRVIAAAKLSKIPKIVVRNENGGKSKIGGILDFLIKCTYPYADAVICQTKEMENENKTNFPSLSDRIVTIPNPIDTGTIKERLKDALSPYKDNQTNFVFVGRIQAVKGLDVLIPAFAEVLKSVRNAKLTIVGDINIDKKYYRKLLQSAEELGIRDNVDFVGFQDNPYKFMKYADCLVLPSRIEGNPNVLHEAMWLKTPVVATKSVPVVSQIVSPERGITVEVDDIDGLAKAMVMALELKPDKDYTNGDYKQKFLSLFETTKHQ